MTYAGAPFRFIFSVFPLIGFRIGQGIGQHLRIDEIFQYHLFVPVEQVKARNRPKVVEFFFFNLLLLDAGIYP